MLIEVVLFAALSGDIATCPANKARLGAIATALERRPMDATLRFWEAASWAQCGQLQPALAALDRTFELGDGFLRSDALDHVLGLAIDARARRLYGRVLFVAHATGIARVTLQATATAALVNKTRETIAGIDGLYWRKGRLIGVQNITHPGRAIEIALDGDQLAVASVRTLLSHHHPELNEPTTGALAGNRFLVLANSYVGELDEAGRIRDPEVLRDPVVLAIPLAE